MKISLILTCIHRSPSLIRLIDSLRNTDVRIDVIFVNQGVFSCEADFISFANFIFPNGKVELVFVDVDRRISISAARNIGLKYISKDDDTIIGFPDDDCWYSEFFFDGLLLAFRERPQAKFIAFNVFDPYVDRSLGIRWRWGGKVRIGYHNVMFLPISVGIFIINQAHRELIVFREDLGVGTPVGCGEETYLLGEFLSKNLKGYYTGSPSVFHEAEVYHADLDKVRRYAYGFGTVLKLMERNFSKWVLLSAVPVLVACILPFGNGSSRRVKLTRLFNIVKGYLNA